MTVPEAIETVQAAGSLEVVGDRIRYEVRADRAGSSRIKQALATLRNHKADALRLLRQSQPLGAVLKGQAIELWLAGGDHLFIVADEEDARRLGERRELVYTADEVRRLIRIDDADIVDEIHEWKRKFNACVSELRFDQDSTTR